jgi:peroxiredoxin
MYGGLVKENIEVLSINVGELPDTVENFIKSYNLAYRILLDKDTSVSMAFKVEIPAYVLINKKGQVVFRDDYFPYEKYKELILEGK